MYYTFIPMVQTFDIINVKCLMLDKIRENTFCNHYMYIVCPLIFQYVSNVDYMINQ